MSPRISAAFRRCLVDVDVRALRRIWPEVMPHLPAISTDAEALILIHMARTESESVPYLCRRYSHQWLADRGMQSKLPDHLRPLREQAGAPRIVDAVGISVNSDYPEVVGKISHVMRDAVLDAYADNRRDPQFVRQRMRSARLKERKALGLRRLPQ